MMNAGKILTLMAACGGSISAQQARNTIDELLECSTSEDEVPSGFAAMNISRGLQMLGHIEISDSNRRWYLARACWARLPGPGCEAVLCGARTPRLLDKIEQAANVLGNIHFVRQHVLFPETRIFIERVSVTAACAGDLDAMANAAGIPLGHLPASWVLAHCGENVSQLMKSTTWLDGIRIPNNAGFFNAETLMFPNSEFGGQLNLAKCKDSRTSQSALYLKNQKGSALIRNGADFLARHAVISESGRSWIRYNPGRMELACPALAPLPCTLAKAATMCSGRPPEFLFHGKLRWFSWKSVTPPIAERIADNLNQQTSPLVGASKER